ncbi:MAG: glycosyltransferase [Pirellulaceae bacterium]
MNSRLQNSYSFTAAPLRVQFITTSLPVGGAEVLLLNLVKRLDKNRFSPEVVCLKEAGELGEEFSRVVPVHDNWLQSKWDARVLFRLAKHFRQSKTDAVITVGAGDKMFWGRAAARLAGVPVICSALHSTGWPDGIGTLNRLLTRITDGFIAVAQQHTEHLVQFEKFPRDRVFMIPNGVDTDRFRPNHAMRGWLRDSLGLPRDCKLTGIVAALREEKNHFQFIDAAKLVLEQIPNAHFLIVGDGPERPAIEAHIERLGVSQQIHLLGNRSDTERILAGLDAFCLTSRNEANPVSILEALSCGVPVVAPDVGSISETVLHKHTGLLTEPVDARSTCQALLQMLSNPSFASVMGLAGRQLVRNDWSLDAMVAGYELVISSLYSAKMPRIAQAAPSIAEPQNAEPVPTAQLADPTLVHLTAETDSGPAVKARVSTEEAVVPESFEILFANQLEFETSTPAISAAHTNPLVTLEMHSEDAEAVSF